MSVDAHAVLIQIAMILQDARLKASVHDYMSAAFRCEEIARAAAVDLAITKVHGDQQEISNAT